MLIHCTTCSVPAAFKHLHEYPILFLKSKADLLASFWGARKKKHVYFLENLQKYVVDI